MLAEDFCTYLNKNDIDFFCGVPDSLLKDICAYFANNIDEKKHIITANEGNAIALAAGYYLATGKIALVYMQNSGIGNAINPLLSLTDEDVYNIPLLMLIGWRGEPGIKDEPQHKKQGKVTDKILEAIGVEYSLLSDTPKEAQSQVKFACDYMQKTKKPYALIVKNNTFEKYLLKKSDNNFEMTREEAITVIVDNLKENDVIVSSTGLISRELYEYREKLNQPHYRDFLTVGSMGHSSSIAMGIALQKPYQNVYCFDGDGAAIMHLGALPAISSQKLENFKHIIFNNEVHDSVGAQPSCANIINFKNLADSCGYDNTYSVKTKTGLLNILSEFINTKGANFLEIKVKSGYRKDLGRPSKELIEAKENFMSFILENKTFIGKGSIENLSKILEKNIKKALIFTGKKSFEKIKRLVEPQLKNINVDYYCDFSLNPKAEEVEEAIKKLNSDYDIYIAIGGGSVIDFAKLYKFRVENNISIKEYFESKPQIIKQKKLIAIPTTAGTGSEVTKFAVVYINGIKYSIEDDYILPDYSIVDSQFLKDMPAEIKTPCALDAFSQAIEAFWSVNSTKKSDEYSKRAIILCKKYLQDYINNPNDINSEKMAEASNCAGKAINIAKTTASHALSYVLTSKYNLPHGHAVALSIAKLAKLNFNVNQDNINDKRGIEFVKNKMNDLFTALEIKPEECEEYFINLFKSTNTIYKLKELGINNISEVINFVDISRLNNNPTKLTKNELESLFF